MVPAFIGLALGAAGGLLGAFGKRKAARAEAEAYRINAQQIRERAGIETTLRERQGLREAGSIAAGAGANGLNIAGSAADILRESARNQAFDIQSIKSQSELEAKAAERGAKAAKAAGTLGFIGGVANTAASLLLR